MNPNNRYINLAMPIISFIAQFPFILVTPDLAELYLKFEKKLYKIFQQLDDSHNITIVYSYLLCTFIDEMVMHESWGENSNWSKSTLLYNFHQESWGGENFFAVAQKQLNAKEHNVELLEFIYLCLNLGYKGKFALKNANKNDYFAFIKNIACIVNADNESKNNAGKDRCDVLLNTADNNKIDICERYFQAGVFIITSGFIFCFWFAYQYQLFQILEQLNLLH